MVEEILRTRVNYLQDDWEELLAVIMFVCNNQDKVALLGRTPIEIETGATPIVPIDFDYTIRGIEIYLDIHVATVIASRGVLGTSTTPLARNIKNSGPGITANIVMYLLPSKCRTEL